MNGIRKRISLILILVLSLLLLTGSTYTRSITTSEAEQNSKYIFNMQNQSGKHFMVYIISYNARRINNSWYPQSHHVFEGTYYAAIVPQGEDMATIQDTPFFGYFRSSQDGVFDVDDYSANNANAYLVQTSYEKQPDILVITELQAATAGTLKAFFIDENGTLQTILWDNGSGKLSRTIGNSYGARLTPINYLKFRTRTHSRGDFTGYINSDWVFEPSQRVFTLINRSYDGRWMN